jgi:hypothetical protein
MHTVDTLLFLPIESQLFIFSPIIWSTERNVDIEPLELAADLSGLWLVNIHQFFLVQVFIFLPQMLGNY